MGIGSIALFAICFWYLPSKDISRIRQVKGIGLSEDAKIDQATVEAWKKGRIRARQLTMLFGTFMVAAVMVNFFSVNFAMVDGVYVDEQLGVVLSTIQAALVALGILGVIASVIFSAVNNMKHLGQPRVRM